jgi:riboflavin synthase
MFTGIVEELGTVLANDGHRIAIGCRVVAADARIGDSVAVSGTCLTVVEAAGDRLAFDVSAETRSRTTLGSAASGDPVNLERPATLSSRLGGHLVQGHVDGVGLVTSVEDTNDGGARLAVRLPAPLLRSVVEKGSIALDGVSMTVARLEGDVVELAVIPHTRRATTLGARRAGDALNVEVDLIARYVERLWTSGRAGRATDREERPAWTSA